MPNIDAANIAFQFTKTRRRASVGPIPIGPAKPAHILTPFGHCAGNREHHGGCGQEAQALERAFAALEFTRGLRTVLDALAPHRWVEGHPRTLSDHPHHVGIAVRVADVLGLDRLGRSARESPGALLGLPMELDASSTPERSRRSASLSAQTSARLSGVSAGGAGGHGTQSPRARRVNKFDRRFVQNR